MNPFSYKSSLEAEAAEEWAYFLHDNLFNRLFRAALRGLLAWLKSLRPLRAAAPEKTRTARQPQSRSRSPLPR